MIAGRAPAPSVAPTQAETKPITTSVTSVRAQPVRSKLPRAPVAASALRVSATNVSVKSAATENAPSSVPYPNRLTTSVAAAAATPPMMRAVMSWARSGSKPIRTNVTSVERTVSEYTDARTTTAAVTAPAGSQANLSNRAPGRARPISEPGASGRWGRVRCGRPRRGRPKWGRANLARPSPGRPTLGKDNFMRRQPALPPGGGPECGSRPTCGS